MDDSILVKLAGKYGTPLYVYDGDLIQERCRQFMKAFEGFPVRVKCCYAVKANTNLALLKLIQGEGYGADVVSVGELDAALKSGFKPQDIIYTSNSKSEADVRATLAAGVNLTADNISEVELVKKMGGSRIAFRVNPDVNASTHQKISTALRGSKFGMHFEGDIAFKAVKKAVELSLKVSGIHCHIGSNIKDASAFSEVAHKMVDFAVRLKSELGIQLEFIDFGGGLGIRYKDEAVITLPEFAKAYGNIVADGVGRLGYKPDVWFEPGRFIVGEAGILLAKVNSLKETPQKRFINVDAGFNDLIRPAMYDAYHNIRVAGKAGGGFSYDVAGHLCESGDVLGKDRNLPEVRVDDTVVIENAGAYGFSMASNYNSQPLPAEVLVRKGRADLIRERQSIHELYIRQKMPKDII
ncbi:MAG: diaminopimelate decarboxylase [Candidatus Altiarchaeota archaeon]